MWRDWCDPYLGAVGVRSVCDLSSKNSMQRFALTFIINRVNAVMLWSECSASSDQEIRVVQIPEQHITQQNGVAATGVDLDPTD